MFIVHDGEELLTMSNWIISHQIDLDRFADLNETTAQIVRSLPTTTTQIAVAMGFIFFLFIVVTTGVFLSGGRGFWIYIYGGLLGAWFLHVFTHLAQSILFGGYTPGVISAVLVIIPGSLYIYKRLFETKLLTLKTSLITAFIGFLLFLPGIVLTHQLSQLLENN
jgi:Protein of unknown function with HXXEE motif